jgi:hypothetical protein
VNATQLHQAIMNLPSKKTTWASRFLHAAYDVGHKEALHAAAELVLAAGLPQWLPIESAPKDGTCFVAFIPKNKKVHIVEYVGGKHALTIPGGWNVEPSHWIPIPALPLPPEGDER